MSKSTNKKPINSNKVTATATAHETNRRDVPVDARSLLSFYTSPPAKESVDSNTYHRPRRKPVSQSELKEKRERQRLSSAFFMHTSPNHTFYVSRLEAPLTDPNIPVHWEHVKLVKCLISATQESACSNFVPTAQCPICLEDTCVAPRITRCGHVFCFSCILAHFYSSHNNSNTNNTATSHRSHKCPCCSTTLALEELRPVQFSVVQYPQVGTTMTFQISNNSFCNSQSSEFGDNQLLVNNKQRYTPLLQPDLLLQHLQSDLQQVQQQVQVQQQQVQVQVQQWQDSFSYFTTMTLEAIQFECVQASTDTDFLATKPNKTSVETQQPHTLFYQAADGQFCFLSDFNMSCLAAEFQVESSPSSSSSSSLFLYPLEIQGQVLDIHRIHLTPANRQRYHLMHLPLYMDVTMVELNLHAILSRETKLLFKTQLDQRKKERQDRKNREKKKNGHGPPDGTHRPFHTSVENHYDTTWTQQPFDLASSLATTLHMDDFGPLLPTMDETQVLQVPRKSIVNSKSPAPPISSEFSYRTVCASGGLFPSLPKLDK